MAPADAEYYGVADGDRMSLRVESSCTTVFEGLLVRVGKKLRLEVHLDTDEGNACDIDHAGASGIVETLNIGKFFPSPFGRGAGGEGIEDTHRQGKARAEPKPSP